MVAQIFLILIFWSVFPLWFAALILEIVEIARGQNDSGWKTLWILLSLFLGVIGILLYLLIGRKELKGKKIGSTKWLLIADLLLIAVTIILILRPHEAYLRGV